MTPAEFKRTWRNRPLVRYAIATWDAGFQSWWSHHMKIAAMRRQTMYMCRTSVCDICREKNTHCTAEQRARQFIHAKAALDHIRKMRISAPAHIGRRGYLP